MKKIEEQFIESISPESEPDYKKAYALIEKCPDVSQEFVDALFDKMELYGWKEPYFVWVRDYESGQDEILKNASQRYNKEQTEKREREERLSLLTANESIPRAGDIPKEVKPFNPISMDELSTMDIPPIEYLVDEILPKGLGILSAPPKYYKSFLALQLCISVCSGNRFLKHDTHDYTCLYFDLESGNRRPRDRAVRMCKSMNVSPPDNLYVVTLQTDSIRTIKDGFIESMTETIRQYKNVGLVVIDVFQKIRNGSKRNQTAYQYEYEELTPLKQVCEENNVSILLVHHNKKGDDRADVYNNMSGSTAMLGACDFAWVITKEERQSEDAILHVTGRDIESIDVSIRFNKKSLCWEYIGTQEEVETQKHLDAYNQSNVIATIKRLVKDHDGEWECSAREIIDASQYFKGCEIYEPETKVGKIINEFTDLLSVIDRIEVHSKRSSKQRSYRFISH